MVDLKQTAALESYNENSLQSLVWAINTSAGKFDLLFAHCNYPFLRQEIVQQLKTRCSIEKLHQKKSDKKLYTLILDYCKQKKEKKKKLPKALMVLGLESVTSLDVLVKDTNFSRDSFKNNFPFPLVLWVNDRVLTHMIRQAPDLKSWAKTIKFLIPAEKIITTLHQQEKLLFQKILDAGLEKFLSNQDIFGQSYRPELDSALRDLEECEQILDEQLKASLDFFEGREKYALILSGKDHKKELIDEALQDYQKSLEFWQKTHQLKRQGVVQYHLGLCYSLQADLEQATEGENFDLLEKAKSYFQQCIDTFKQTQNQDLVAKFINQLATVLQQLTDCYQSEINEHKKLLNELKKIAQESLELQQINQNRVREAEAHGFLAYVACQKEDWQSAKSFAEEAIKRINEVSERKKMQPALFYLAQSQWHLNQQDKAIETMEEARKLGLQEQEYPKPYLNILETLRLYYREKQEYLLAFYVRQEQSSIEQQFYHLVFIGADCLSPRQRFDRGLEVASEIECSPSRKKDLDALYKRITDSPGDYRLTILHGTPGVGKSSLLRAGLIPALQKAQDNSDKLFIPIILSNNDYKDKDWLSSLETKIAKTLGNGSDKSGGTERTPESLINFLKAKINEPRGKSKIIVLIFDDFEEFLLNKTAVNNSQLFSDFLIRCLETSFIKLIISIKEHYLTNLLDLEKELMKKPIGEGLDILSRLHSRYRLENFSREDAESIIRKLIDDSRLKWQEDLIQAVLQRLTVKSEKIRPLELQLLGKLLQIRKTTTATEYQRIREQKSDDFLKEIIEECGYQKVAQLVLYLLTIPEDSETCPRKTISELISILELVRTLVGAGLLKQQDSSPLTSELEDFPEKVKVVLEILTGWRILINEGTASRGFQYQLVNESLRDYIKTMAKTQLGEDLCEKLKQPETAIRRTLLIETIKKLTLLIETIKKLNSEASALLLEKDQLGSLLCSLEASKKFLENQTLLEGNEELKAQTSKTIKTIFYAIQERNRFKKYAGDVYCVSFSPNKKEEEQLIVSGGADKTIKLWRRNGQLYKELQATNGHADWVTAVCFSPDGQLIASGSADRTIKLWSRDGDYQKTLGAKEHTDWVRDVCFSPDGQLIASASKVRNDKDWTIQLWEIDTGNVKQLKSSMSHEQSINCVTFSPDGQIIASASGDGSIKLWNLDGTERKTFAKYSKTNQDGHCGAVNSVNFHKEGKILVSASSDETIKLWDLDGKCLATLRGHDEIVRRVRFNPDGTLLASASDDHTVKVWSVDRTWLPNPNNENALKLKLDGTLLTTFEGHGDPVWDVNFSPDGRILASASEDNTVRLWDLDVVFPQNLQAHEDKIWSISFSPDSKFLATGSSDNIIKLWRLDDGQPQLWQELRGHKDWVWGINFSPDGKIMVSGGGDKTIKLWRWDETQNKYVLFKSHDSAHVDCVCCVKFSPDGTLLASASADKTIKLWDTNEIELWNPNETNAKPKILLYGYPKSINGHRDRVYSIDFSRDGQRIVSCSADCTLKIWSRNGELIKSIDKGDKDDPQKPGHTEWVNQASFSPNSQLIASASNDNMIKIWDRDGNHQKTIKGHRYKVWSARFLDDETLVSVGDDKAIKLWNLQGEELKTNLKGVSNRITNIKISPDRKILAASTNHGIIQLWNLDQVTKASLSFEKLIEAALQWVQDYEKPF